MDSDTLKFVANFLAKKVAAYLAASLVTIGALHPGSDETQFITMISGVIVGVVAFAWSWWNDRGKQKVLAALAKAHKVAPADATVAAASKAIVASVNDNKVTPIANGAVKIAAMLLIGFFLCSLAFPAYAQTKAATPSPADVVTNLIKNINNIGLADLQNAQALAQAMPNKVTAPCWTAVVNMVQKQQAILNPPTPAAGSSSPPPLPSVHIFTDAEKLSEIIQSLQTGGDIQINCAAMADASKKSVLQIVSAIISGASVAPLIPIVP